MIFPRTQFMSLSVLCLVLAIAQAVDAKIGSDKDWPRQIEVPKGTIVIYQPQLEMFNGVELKSRAAIAVTPKGEEKPSYGAVWIEARLFTDRDRRLASMTEIKVPRARFAGSTPEQEKKLTAFLEEEIPKWELTLSLDRLLQGMESASGEIRTEEQLIVDPPKIVVSEVPAVLISIIGDIKLKPVEGMKLMRVVNSPYQVFYDQETKKYYLNGGSVWFTAHELKGEWMVEEVGPAELDRLYASRSTPSNRDLSEQPPRIIVSSEPTELIVFDGPPKFKSLVGTDLLYVFNTESNVFLESKTRQIYVLLEGRWFRSASLEGPWEAVTAAKPLPACFSMIAAGSAKGNILVHVAGTEAAKDAVMDSQIPQTAVILKKEAILQVTYDGDPVFKPISGPNMKYAVNSPDAVIELDNHYYACQYAIWYESETPNGPWSICETLPAPIQTIPSSCPLYYVKFARIYDSTPDSVYVGYTPGYLGSYVANGAIIYGTGHTYQDWYNLQYIARPLTWGLRALYDPARGDWRLFADYVSPGGSYRIIPGSVDGGGNRIRRWSMSGWWGAGGYRDYEDMSGRKTTSTMQRRNAPKRKLNIYNMYEAANRLVSVQRPESGSRTYAAKVAKATSDTNNDLYTDRTGTVYRRTKLGWEKREVVDWIKARTADSASLSKMEEEHLTRERGMAREQKYETTNRSE